jgi:hypothetical protein
MENENILDGNSLEMNSSANRLAVSPKAMAFLSETSGWGKFLAIVGFCFAGLIVILGFSLGAIFSSMGMDQQNPFSGYIGVIYSALGVLYFFPSYYLYKFSSQLKIALKTKDDESLAVAFENLKSLYKFMGIFTIIIIGLYGVVGGGALLISLFNS